MAANRNPLSAGAWRGRIAACKTMRKRLLGKWQDNVSYREGHPFKSTPSEDTINIPADWSRTKNKQAQLFSQLPELKLIGRRDEWKSVAPVFAAALNFELSEKIHAEHMMNECLGDVINASGVAICKVGYEATFEDVDMAAQVAAPQEPVAPPPPGPGGLGDPLAGPAPAQLGPPQTPLGGLPPSPAGPLAQAPPPIAAPDPLAPPAPDPLAPAVPNMVPRPIYECYYAKRISPAHFLWPSDFTGSNWQEAEWLGHEGYLPVAEAQRKGWVDKDYEGGGQDDPDWLLVKEEQQKATDGWVKYYELFYHPATYDVNEKDPRKIKRVVLVDAPEGDKVKVLDEDFEWQRYNPATRTWVGMTTYPIKVVTIAKISDRAIPPSDSEMGRPQVRELIKARSQMIKQRDHSLPMRWYDVNAVDDEIADRLRKGRFPDMIPMNGPGDRAIGEVSRAHYPPESFEFNKVIREDLDEAWSMGNPQLSTPTTGETTATEIKSMETSLNVRLKGEQGWITQFYLEVAQAVGHLMQLFADDTDYALMVGLDGAQTLHAWNKDTIQGEYVFKIKPDSQLQVDVQAKRVEALNMYKLLRQDPLINPQGLVSEVLELHGIDPAKSMVPAQPPKPEKPKVGYSFKGEDLVNPLVVALIQKTDTPITPEDIAKAKALLEDISGMLPPQPTLGGDGPEMGGPPTGDNPPHPGPPEVQQPLNRRYAEKTETDTGGSRDSAVPTPKK